MKWVIGDDLVAFQSKGKEHVDADETIVIAIGKDPHHLKIREVDLTTMHADEVRAFLEPYIKAGHMPGSQPGPGDQSTLVPEVPRRLGGERREIAGTRVFYRNVRLFADQHGYVIGGTRKNRKYPPELMPAYIKSLQEQVAADPGCKAAWYLDMAAKLNLIPGEEHADR